jgi:hypothetical protein
MDPLADPLNRRYRPFGEWAQDQLRQPNLFYNRTGTATATPATPDRRGSATGSTGNPGSGVARSPFATTAAAAPATATPAAAPAAAPANGVYSTAGRTGATYDAFLAANPQFDPWTNLDQYAGQGAGNDPILAQAFGWTNEWARNNGYGDGKNIPLAQRQKVFLANVERARQQWTDNTNDPGARRGITWEQSQASRLPNQGWAYTAGTGGRTTPATTVTPTTTTAPGATTAATTGGQQTGGPNVADPNGITDPNDPTRTINPNDPSFKGAYWMTHPQEVADQFVRAHNVNPDQHTAMGDWLLKLVNGIAPDIMSTYFGSNGKLATDALADPNQLLNSIFYNGGGIGQNLQNYAQTAMNTLRGNPTMASSLGDSGIQDFLARLNGLNTFGMNPYMAQAYGNAYDSQMNRGLRNQRDQLFRGAPQTSLWDFINQAGQPGFSSYGLPGGGGGGGVGATGGGGVQNRY